MAQHYIGANKGQAQRLNPGSLTTGTVTGSTDIELRWDDTKNLTRLDINQFLETLEVFLNSQYVTSAVPKL